MLIDSLHGNDGEVFGKMTKTNLSKIRFGCHFEDNEDKIFCLFCNKSRRSNDENKKEMMAAIVVNGRKGDREKIDMQIIGHAA